MPVVLVVEDEPLLRVLVCEELVNSGYEVIEAPTADHAIALLEARPEVQLMFTDIDMPGSMDGLRLAAVVRDRWPPVHIIVTSGKIRPMTIPGNALFIPKPYLLTALVSAIQTFEKMR